MTREEILKKNRKSGSPDMTYDLNNDGVISSREYFIARRFDKNKDGKLEPKERETALKALKEGYENEFLFGLDKCGSVNGRRVLQVRGKIVDGEDFLPVTDTYPKFSHSNKKSIMQSSLELKANRKTKLK